MENQHPDAMSESNNSEESYKRKVNPNDINLPPGYKVDVFTEGFNPPLTGINYLDGNIYVSHRGFITIIKPDGTKEDIVSGLPSFGDHHNNQVDFGPDG